MMANRGSRPKFNVRKSVCLHYGLYFESAGAIIDTAIREKFKNCGVPEGDYFYSRTLGAPLDGTVTPLVLNIYVYLNVSPTTREKAQMATEQVAELLSSKKQPQRIPTKIRSTI